MDNSQDIAELQAKLEHYRDLVDELVEALEYCIKQIPEFADVPGIKAALAKVRGEK